MNKQDLKNIVVEVWAITQEQEYILDQVLSKYTNDDLDEKCEEILNELNKAVENLLYKK